MRPGPLLIRLAVIIAASSLIVAAIPPFVYVLCALSVLLVLFVLAEALALRRITLTIERQPKLAVPLGEAENTTVRVETNARTTLRLTIRQRWPEIVEPRSTMRDATIRAGEGLALDLKVRGIERGPATIEPLYIAFTMRGLVERIVPAGEATGRRVLPPPPPPRPPPHPLH